MEETEFGWVVLRFGADIYEVFVKLLKDLKDQAREKVKPVSDMVRLHFR